MPIKLFEYLSNMVPIIATTKTVAGKFVKQNKIGWSIPHSEEKLEEILHQIYCDREILNEKNNVMEEVLQKNTWIERARTVIGDLT